MANAKIKGRDGRGRATRSPANVAEDLKAADLRSKSKSYRQIAEELGVDVSTAFRMVQRGIQHIPTEGAEEARRIEIEKLDAIERAAWTVLEAHHLVVIMSGPEAGRIVYSPDKPDEPLTDSAPVLAAIDRIAKVSESRRKLLGLDAPRQSEVHVITEDLVDAEIRRLEARLADNDPVHRRSGEAASAS